MKNSQNICNLVLFLYIFSLVHAVLPKIALAAGGVNELAEELMSQLSRQVRLSGLAIQLEANNFTELGTGMRAPFAAALSEALAAELARRSARVSIHEQGVEPLRLTGSYELYADDLTVTLRLRQMGIDGSRELAVVRQSIARRNISRELLSSSLDILASSLLRQLEQSPMAGEGMTVEVSQPIPAIPGRPTLQLGSALRQAFERAVSRSEVFGSLFVVGASYRKLRLDSSYSVDGKVRVAASLRGEDNTVSAEAVGELQAGVLSPTLFAMVQDRKQDVCISYAPVNSRAVPAASPTVREVMNGLTDTLTDLGIRSLDCSQLQSGIRVEVSLLIGHKKLRDGYGILTGDLQLQLYDDGRPSGIVNARERLPYTGHANEMRPELVRKLFTPVVREQLAAKVLAYRPE